jgi:xylan 1,4-beta-xylosidase
MPITRSGLLVVLLASGSPAADPSPTPAPVAFEWFEYTGHDGLFAPPLAPGSYQNPILAGFYPDPSVVRVRDDFYLVNSSFAYAPGIPIFHSRDLVHWRPLGHVLDRPSQLDFHGLGVSRGVFAPAISYHSGTYYVVNTLVDAGGNFYVTATDPAGPWSDPVWLRDVDGIDPSFFFDEDGRAYLVNNGPPIGAPLYDGHRAIWIQEFDAATGNLVGPRSIIVNGGVDIAKKPVWIEGPHLFRRGDWYYLICAEGGTSAGHSEVVFRSRSPFGPYVPWERNPILTQRDLPEPRADAVSSTGHADFVEAPDGAWWAVFLGCRPYEDDLYNTGRETFLLPVTWVDDWPLILAPKTPVPLRPAAPKLAAGDASAPPLTGNFTSRDDFDGPALDPAWNVLRGLAEPVWDLRTRPGMLRLSPRPETLSGKATPAFLGRRQQHTAFDAALRLEVPKAAGVSAGIAAFQNETHYLFLGVRRTSGGIEVSLERADGGPPMTVAQQALAPDAAGLSLKITGDGARYSFSYDTGGHGWKSLAESLDGRLLSTARAGGFVGVTVGPYARLDP